MPAQVLVHASFSQLIFARYFIRIFDFEVGRGPRADGIQRASASSRRASRNPLAFKTCQSCGLRSFAQRFRALRSSAVRYRASIRSRSYPVRRRALSQQARVRANTDRRLERADYGQEVAYRGMIVRVRKLMLREIGRFLHHQTARIHQPVRRAIVVANVCRFGRRAVFWPIGALQGLCAGQNDSATFCVGIARKDRLSPMNLKDYQFIKWNVLRTMPQEPEMTNPVTGAVNERPSTSQ